MKEQGGLFEDQGDEDVMAQLKDTLKEIRLPSETKPDLKDRIKHLFSPSAEFERCIVDVEDFTISSLESYEKRIKQLEEALESMTHAAKELHGVVTEYCSMPCKSLESRMTKTANRYKNRIFKPNVWVGEQP